MAVRANNSARFSEFCKSLLSFIQQHGRIKRAEVMALCHLDDDQAYRLLKRLVEEGKLANHGERRGAYYTLAES